MKKHDHTFFFVDGAEAEGVLRLSREELHHALSALRMGSGASLTCTDGKGGVFACVQTPQTFSSGEVRIAETACRPRPLPRCSVCIGLPDRDAFEEALTDLAALGAARIVPLICRFCQNSWWDRWDIYADRFRRKMVAGIKQSLNPWLPELTAPQSFMQTVNGSGGADKNVSLVANADGIAVRQALEKIAVAKNVACFIGPPGGFSPEERTAFHSPESVMVNIGPYRLRTELAATVLCASVMQAGAPEGYARALTSLESPSSNLDIT